jgi:hypothetical protein
MKKYLNFLITTSIWVLIWTLYICTSLPGVPFGGSILDGYTQEKMILYLPCLSLILVFIEAYILLKNKTVGDYYTNLIINVGKALLIIAGLTVILEIYALVAYTAACIFLLVIELMLFFTDQIITQHVYNSKASISRIILILLFNGANLFLIFTIDRTGWFTEFGNYLKLIFLILGLMVPTTYFSIYAIVKEFRKRNTELR